MTDIDFGLGMDRYCTLTGAPYKEEKYKQMTGAIYQRVKNWPVNVFNQCLDLLAGNESIPRNLWGSLKHAKMRLIEDSKESALKPRYNSFDIRGQELQRKYMSVIIYIHKNHSDQRDFLINTFHERYWMPYATDINPPPEAERDVLFKKINEFMEYLESLKPEPPPEPVIEIKPETVIGCVPIEEQEINRETTAIDLPFEKAPEEPIIDSIAKIKMTPADDKQRVDTTEDLMPF
jgi:hypothetical protein